MTLKHRAFNIDRFVDKFEGHEDLLWDYVKLWGNRLKIKTSSLTLEAFKTFLVNGEGDARDLFMAELYRVYDLCTERGHEDLVAACRDQPEEYAPDPQGILSIECLSLKVRTENEDAFNLAYDRCTLRQAERFSVYQGKKGQAIKNIRSVTRRLRDRLAALFKDDKNSDRVLIRQYQEGSRVNFIVYHEKRTQALLIFKGTKTKPRVSPEILRPAQQDFISYDSEAGRVEVEARFPKEEGAFRKTFAECCLGDADLFEKPEAADRIKLARIAADDFTVEADGEDTAAMTELHFKLKQKHGPFFVVRSKNVLETLQLGMPGRS